MPLGRGTAGQGDQVGLAATIELGWILPVYDAIVVERGRQARRDHGLANVRHGHFADPEGLGDGGVGPSRPFGAGLGFEQNLGVHDAARRCLTAPDQFAALLTSSVGKLHHILSIGHWGRPRAVM